ncbi:nitrite reductase large subunit NirB [Psychromonas sp.]|uniref:nitrite reductase large subunit NirB n=1 Tax=Psychromonas sp. TaxID=1884585 RepID=UPI003562B1EC
MNQQNIIVIGNGMVGYKFCERLSDKDTQKKFKIITFCEEPRPAYDRVHLSAYFEGKTAEELSMASINWYKERDIDIYLQDKVISIDRDKKTVTSEKGRTLSYDKIVMATGSSVFVPPVPGIDKEGVFVYRTIEDLEEIIAYAKNCKTCAVIGGGLLGLEAAKAAQELGLQTDVIEFAPRLMPRQVDDAGGEMLKQLIEAQGMRVNLNKNTKKIIGETSVTAMEFVDGSVIQTDMIIISAGIRPRDDLARESGLTVGERGGILVNSSLKTSDPDIYAIGECVLYGDIIYGLVAPGFNMADAVAEQLVGNKSASFTGADMSTKLKLMGTDVASFGDIEPKDKLCKDIALNNPHTGVYKKLVISEDGKRLLGGVLVGDANEYGNLLQICQNNMKLPDDPMSLILPKNDDAESGIGIGDLPDTAHICSCENVTKGDILDAIENHACNSVSEIKSFTKAGTGCGGCIPMLTDLFKYKMAQDGIEVSNALCEHFELSREEMYQVVRATGIKTFAELIAKHGKGAGCEICKPAAASIFATVFSEPILDHASLQDTNDAFLANIQQDGTYSVIPGIPGGEITPDMLMVIAEVGKKFDLYTKITGGQRIDLLGARLDQLPQIWKILIDAGFESGHAYGKSLRTVKSCVGSTWCRYGVQDSTSLAIELELRYRGLRSPHKIKGAVSGCTRECAEAQCKDFGVIATDKGWNLYICGNGGIKPRHADLFASDLDKETLIKYIDRFLMYYIKTADRLQRTSTWMTKLPGGLAHVKDVVINDSLGINSELEAQMQHVVNTYECEWTNVLNDPEKLKRFKHFVNSDDLDETVQFTRERLQIRPLQHSEKP